MADTTANAIAIKRYAIGDKVSENKKEWRLPLCQIVGKESVAKLLTLRKRLKKAERRKGRKKIRPSTIFLNFQLLISNLKTIFNVKF